MDPMSGGGLLITTLPANMLDNTLEEERSSTLRQSLDRRRAGAHWQGSSSRGRATWPAADSFRNPALQAFARTRMPYQLLSLVAVRGDAPGVELYTNEETRFAWAFDPARYDS